MAEPVAANACCKTVATGKYCATSGCALSEEEHASVDGFIIQSCCAFALLCERVRQMFELDRMTAQSKRSWTVEEYLAFERSSDVKHEDVEGDVCAVAGATATHNIIVANIIASLHAQTRQRECTVFPILR